MKYYVAAPFGADRRDEILSNGFGLLYSPTYRKVPRACEDGQFVLDNGAFSAYVNGSLWDERAFYSLADQVFERGISPVFVVLPDIVAGGPASLDRSVAHIRRLPTEWRKYLPVQDGMTAEHVDPIASQVDGVFVGGSVGWKWRTAHAWCEFAHGREIACHIGRVNSFRQILSASRCGADSADGSTASRHHALNKLIRHTTSLQDQGAVA